MLHKELLDKINREFDELYTQNESLLANGMGQSVADMICENVTASVTNKSGMYFDELLNKKQAQALAAAPFAGSAANANKLYALDLKNDLRRRYSFDQTLHLTPVQAQSLLQKMFPSLGVITVGSVLCLVLHSKVATAVCLPVFIVFAGALYVFYERAGEQKNAQTAQTELKQSLTELKNSLIQWLEEIDRIYQQRLDEMKKTL